MVVHKRWAAAWVSTVAGLGVLDYVLDRRHDGSTLSECARWLFRTDTLPGKVAVTAAISSGAYVLNQHLIRSVVYEIEEALGD